MIDFLSRLRLTNFVGREDRALLRSNRSARTDAGTEAGRRLPTPSLPSPLGSCLGPKAINLGSWGGAPTLPSYPFLPLPECHLSRSLELAQNLCPGVVPLGLNLRAAKPVMRNPG
jgi:hypothetical protein